MRRLYQGTKARPTLVRSHPLDGVLMKRDALYFRLSVVWLVILASGFAFSFLWFG
jgi:hypothetical protein